MGMTNLLVLLCLAVLLWIGFEIGKQWERRRILRLFPNEWCTDGEYTEAELLKAEGSIVKGIYNKI